MRYKGSIRRLIAVIAVLSLVVAACTSTTDSTTTTAGEAPQTTGGSDAPDTTEGAGEEEPDAPSDVALTFSNWFFGGPIQAAYEPTFEEFVENTPEVVEIGVDVQPFVRYQDVLNIRVASGDAPDVAWVFAPFSAGLIEAGQLYDLRPAIEAFEGFDMEDLGSNVDAFKRGDAIYGLPFSNATNIMFYNKDLFAQAGLESPIDLEARGEWTWEKVREMAAALVDSSDARYGFVLGNNIFTNGWQNVIDLWAPYGARPWSLDGTECELATAETVEATTLLHNMMFEDGSYPTLGVEWSFPVGDIGMSLTRGTTVGALADATFEWDVIRAPDGPLGYVPSRAINPFVVFKDVAHPDLAAELAVYMASPGPSARWGVSASPRESLNSAERLAENLPAFTPEQIERSELAAVSAEQFVQEYAHINYGPLKSELQRLFDSQLWVAGADVPAVMESICGEIAPFLQG